MVTIKIYFSHTLVFGKIIDNYLMHILMPWFNLAFDFMHVSIKALKIIYE